MVRCDDQLDTSVRIVTPENIAFEYEAAGPFRRLPAYLIDLGIRVGLWIGAMFVFGMLGVVLHKAALGLFLLFWFGLEWFYGGLFETYCNGQTPGKRLTRIRVVGVDGTPVNGLQAVLRNILRAVDVMPVLPIAALGVSDVRLAIPSFMVGLVTPALNRRCQRMGDLVCGTMVIVEKRDRLSGLVKLEDPRATRLANQLPIHIQVDRQVSRALSAYAERRRSFTEPRRREIARHLALPLLERYHLPDRTDHDLLLCALYHRTFVADVVTRGEPL